MSKRIKALASLVLPNSIVADIGTDHAYLIIELFKNNKIKYAYAIDNKSEPIKNATKNITRNNLSNKVTILKADGLSFPFRHSIDTLVFAGLGGLNVIEMIKKNINKLKDIHYIITDIHRDNIKLEQYLSKVGFKIEEEKVVIDKKITYNLRRYKKYENN